MMKTRMMNIELLRIVAMFLITLWHFHEWYLLPNIENIDRFTAKFVGISMNFLPFHVNAFVLISGFFGIKSSSKGMVQIYTMCLFYMVLNFALNVYIGNSFDLVKLIFPISHGGWWFINIYFLLLILAPYINLALDQLDRKRWKLLLCSLALIDCYFGFIQHLGTLYNYGYDLMNMITVYIVGRFMSTIYCMKPKMKKSCFLFCFFIFAKVAFYYVGKILNINLILGSNDYCNPLLILAAVYFFFMFWNIKIEKSKWILFFSKSVVGVYLLTSCTITQPMFAEVFSAIYSNLKMIPYSGVISVLLMIIFIFLIVTLVDKVRLLLCSKLNQWLQNKIDFYINAIIK